MSHLRYCSTTAVLLGLLSFAPASAQQPGHPTPETPRQKTYSFEFHETPWEQVFARLSCITHVPVITSFRPVGTFTMVPPRINRRGKQYTVGEIMDALNESLAPQKRQVVRGQASLTICPTNRAIDPDLVRAVSQEELSECGKSEVVKLKLQIKLFSVETLGPTIKKLMGPCGQVFVLDAPNQLILIDTASNLINACNALTKMERGPGETCQSWCHVCKHCKATTVAEELQQLFHILQRVRPEWSLAISIAADPRTNAIFISGKARVLARARAFVDQVENAPGHHGHKAVSPP